MTFLKKILTHFGYLKKGKETGSSLKMVAAVVVVGGGTNQQFGIVLKEPIEKIELGLVLVILG